MQTHKIWELQRCLHFANKSLKRMKKIKDSVIALMHQRVVQFVYFIFLI